MLVKSTTVALMVAVGSANAAVMYGKESVMRDDPDFGLCLPTIKFEGGLGGRPSMDFSFLPSDALCARGQQAASNPSELIQVRHFVHSILTPNRHHHQPHLRPTLHCMRCQQRSSCPLPRVSSQDPHPRNQRQIHRRHLEHPHGLRLRSDQPRRRCRCPRRRQGRLEEENPFTQAYHFLLRHRMAR